MLALIGNVLRHFAGMNLECSPLIILDFKDFRIGASLHVWKEISSFEDHVSLEPEPYEMAHEAGEVVTVEIVDLLNDTAESFDCFVPIELRSHYRQLEPSACSNNALVDRLESSGVYSTYVNWPSRMCVGTTARAFVFAWFRRSIRYSCRANVRQYLSWQTHFNASHARTTADPH